MPNEELYLMNRWLGPESTECIRRIKVVNVRDAPTGLQKAWLYLEECYGCPEVIEKSLFDRLNNFPKITNKDVLKLRELGDLLRELGSAKTEGY